MADKNINQLTEDTSPTGDDFVPTWDSTTGATKKATLTQVLAILGGVSDSNVVATSQNTSSTSFTDLGTVGPSVTVTIGTSGKALVLLTTQMANDTAFARNLAGYVVSGANTIAASDTKAVFHAQVSGSAAPSQLSAVYLLKGLSPGSTTFKMQYRVTDPVSTGSFVNREIAVIPL